MNFKTKTGSITKILYTILILCIIGIMVLSVYSLFNQNNQNDAGNMNSLKSENELNNNNSSENNGNQDGVLQNPAKADDIIDYDSEEALKNFYRNQTSENPENPENIENTTGHQTQPSNAAQSLTTAKEAAELPAMDTEELEELNHIEPTIPADDIAANVNEQNEQNNQQDADLIIEPTEEAVEVIAAAGNHFIKPADGIVLKAHNPDIPEYSVVMNDYRTHIGIDIESENGADVKTVCDGIISEITDDPLMGKTIVITHADNIQSVYMNLQEQLPQNIIAGAEVKCGDIIGKTGNTALIEISDSADTMHLHFEMKKDGEYINPLEYINF